MTKWIPRVLEYESVPLWSQIDFHEIFAVFFPNSFLGWQPPACNNRKYSAIIAAHNCRNSLKDKSLIDRQLWQMSSNPQLTRNCIGTFLECHLHLIWCIFLKQDVTNQPKSWIYPKSHWHITVKIADIVTSNQWIYKKLEINLNKCKIFSKN